MDKKLPMSKEKNLQRVLDGVIVAVLRASSSNQLVQVAETLADVGISSVEVTLTVPGAIEVIRETQQQLGDRLFLGAGTVLDPEMEGNLRVTMVATGIRNPASGIPEVRVIEGGRAGEPEGIDYDQPTVIRRRPRQSAAAAVVSNTAENLDYLDIPAFLRRQAD